MGPARALAGLFAMGAELAVLPEARTEMGRAIDSGVIGRQRHACSGRSIDPRGGRADELRTWGE